jgi:hypothetical protein
MWRTFAEGEVMLSEDGAVQWQRRRRQGAGTPSRQLASS